MDMPRKGLIVGGALAGLVGLLAFRGALHAADGAGYEQSFAGRPLDGWVGAPTDWRVEDGNLVGEVTPETRLRRNSFVIRRGGTPRDFALQYHAPGGFQVRFRDVRIAEPE